MTDCGIQTGGRRFLARVMAGVLLVLLGVVASPVSGQDEPTQQAAEQPTPDARLATPEETMFTFLGAMNEVEDGQLDAINVALLCCDFGTSALPRPAMETQAGDLYNFINRTGLVQPWHFPGSYDSSSYTFFPNPDNPDHRRPSSEVPGLRIELVKNALGEWRFSPKTLEEVEAQQPEWEKLPNLVKGGSDLALTFSQRIRAQVPATLRGRFLSLEYWQWIAVFLVIVIGVVIDHTVRFVLSVIWHRIERKRDGEAERDVLKRAVRPFGWVAAAGFWLLVINLFALSGFVLLILLGIIRIIMTVGAVWAAWRVTDLLASFFTEKAKKTHNKYDDLLIPLLQRSMKIFIFAIGLIYIIKALGQDPLPLLTGLGIGGLAVAFAAKDTIENFFGSIAVIIDQPFEVGDWVVVDDVEGTVEKVGFRSTRVRTFYNSLVTVPNAKLVRAVVDNYGKRQFRRYRAMINLTYSTPPEKIEAFCEGVREIIRLHPYTRKDYFHVYLNNFGAHSLDVLLYVFFECPDWAIELRERQRLMLDIIRLADRLGVSFAFPTQTLELMQVDPSLPHKPSPIPSPTAETDALRHGIETARGLAKDQPWTHTRPGGVTFTARSQEKTEFRGDSGSGE